jgi:hypothetical protein
MDGPNESMARPTELTPEVADRIAQLIRAGNWPETAAVAAGVSERSYYRWMARGEQAVQLQESGKRVHRPEEPYRQFWQQVKRAESESQVIAVSHLMKAMPSTPTAVLAWLERRFRQEWGRTERQELSGPGGGPSAIASARERLEARLAAVAAREAATTVVASSREDVLAVGPRAPIAMRSET